MEEHRTKRKAPVRFSRFVFTLNNYTEEEFASVKAYPCRWMVCARETGDENQTAHLQGACILDTRKSLVQLKKIPGFERAHIEMMKGKPEDSVKYCCKQDKAPFTKGKLPNPGKRNDLQEVAEMVMDGATMEEVARHKPTAIIQYNRGLTALRSYVIPPRRPSQPPCIVWIHGASGTGKTRAAFETGERLFGEGTVWMSNGSLQWFDGYDGHPVAIIDDLRTKHTEFSELLRVLDRYPYRVPVKCGHQQWVPRLIFVTCPWEPTVLWSLRTEEQLLQLTRRVNHTIRAPDELQRVYEMLCNEDYTVVVPVLPGEQTDPSISSEEEVAGLSPYTMLNITEYFTPLNK